MWLIYTLHTGVVIEGVFDLDCTGKTHMSDIVAIAFLTNGNCDEVLMTKLRTWLQQEVYMAKGYNYFTLAWTPRYFPLILLASS